MTADNEKNEPMVRFSKVQKSYDGETLVVKDLNLDIAKGEFLTMLGPSGSGKTTTLMMLAGFEPATTPGIHDPPALPKVFGAFISANYSVETAVRRHRLLRVIDIGVGACGAGDLGERPASLG